MTDRRTVAARTAAQRDAMYHRLLAALRETGPDAPNVCEGWTSREMLTHVWLMKHDPVALPGIVVPALEGWARSRGEKALEKVGGYEAMISTLEGEPGSRFPLIGDTLPMARADLGEWYVHLRDVTDPNGLPAPELDAHLRRSLWVWLKKVAPMARTSATLVEPVLGRHHHVGREAGPIVVGEAGELLCWLMGRWADVEVMERQVEV